MCPEISCSERKVEIFDLRGSYFDVMVVLKGWKVYEDNLKDEENFLIVDTDNALPGFASLKTSDNWSVWCSRTRIADR